jgi:type I restriction enzyme M protein
VDIVDPKPGQTIYDPACGTAGFLISAYKHILKNNTLTPTQKLELSEDISGVDIDPGMAKIARVNLFFHDFKSPKISEDDTLSNQKLWGKKFDVILANPPFMTPR